MTVRLNIAALHGVYVTVADARRSAEWYTRCFGMSEMDYGPYRSIRLPEGASIVLVESAIRNVYESSPFHFKCNDARRAHDELAKRAVKVTEPVNWHNYVDFCFWDPDGNPVGVISDPAWAPHPNNYFRMDGVFLGSANFESTLDWYLNLFGTEIEYDFTVATTSSPEARMCCLRGVPFTLFESPAGAIYHRFCDFRTRDAEADYAYLLEKGVRLTPLLIGRNRISFSFFDPDGREFGFLEDTYD